MRGVSLAELSVSVALLGLLIMFVITLLPSSVVTLRRADAMQSATAYAVDMIEQARTNPALGVGTAFLLDLEGGHFQVVRTVTPADAGLQDVVVTLRDTHGHVVTIGTRMPRAAASP
jgi:type II secretory pathway pseudopilin PulG